MYSNMRFCIYIVKTIISHGTDSRTYLLNKLVLLVITLLVLSIVELIPIQDVNVSLIERLNS